MKVLLAAVFLFLSLLAKAQLGFAGDAGVEWSTVTMGQRSGVERFSTFVLTSQNEFENYWRRNGNEGTMPGGHDFQKFQLVAIHLGSRPTGGFQVSVEKIARVQATTIQISYVEQKPDRNQIVTQALTSPWVIVRVRRVGGSFSFAGRTQIGPFPGGGPILTPGPGGGPIWGGVPFDTLYSGVNSTSRSFRIEVIESQAELRSHVREYLRGTEFRPINIDWNEESVVAIHLGQRRTLGYQVIVSAVEPTQTGLRILWTEVRPGPGSMAPQALSYPYALVRVPKAPVYDFASQLRYIR